MLVFAILLPGCQSEAEHPPEYVPDLGVPRSCEELASGQVAGGRILVAGQPARCAADGLQCALFGLSGCDGGQVVVADCVNLSWLISCVTPPDAAP
jgi:hypothetical protein